MFTTVSKLHRWKVSVLVRLHAMLNLDPIVRLRHCTGGIQSSSMGLRFYGGMLEGDLTRSQAGDGRQKQKIACAT